MLVVPKCVGTRELSKEEVKKDKKKCMKIGPCGVGKKALYLNSFFIDRRYYVCWEDVSRVYKQVAMSKGGFSGKGAFGTMAYLVVLLKDGTKRRCNFKFENNVDILLGEVEAKHPYIHTHSEEAEKKLRKAEEEEKKKYVKHLSKTARDTISDLEEDKDFLEQHPSVWQKLSAAAKQKRVVDHINPTYRIVAGVILGMSLAAIIFGIWALTQKKGGAIYFVLFGIAFIFFVMATRVMPTGKRNKATAQKEWDEAVEASRRLVNTEADFPVPAQYAHPVVIERMIREIRMGKCETAADAYELMKKDLKALNNTVTVSQKEYDEVVEVKPMFLVCDYH